MSTHQRELLTAAMDAIFESIWVRQAAQTITGFAPSHGRDEVWQRRTEEIDGRTAEAICTYLRVVLKVPS